MKNKSSLAIIALLSLVTISGILSFLLIQLLDKEKSRDEPEVQDKINLSTNSQNSYEDDYDEIIFEGNYVRTKADSNWDIVELSGPSGMYSFTQGEVNGLSGIELKLENELVFSIKGVDGVGSNPLCSIVYKFDDTNPDYISSYINSSEDSIEVIDLTMSDYREFELLGREIRRVNTDYYWDQLDNTSDYFNPECGFYSSFIILPEWSIDINRPGNLHDSVNLFKLELMLDRLDESKLKELDIILENLSFN